MKDSYKVIIAGLLVALVATVMCLFWQTKKAPEPVVGNASYSVPTTQTAAATTSVAYITAGAATSTLSLDTYINGNPQLAEFATLLVQVSASTSVSAQLKLNVEYSQDGVDWYQDGGNALVGQFATTTKPFDISQVNQFTLNYASSTAGLGTVAATAATTTRALPIKTPTRWVRAIFTVPAGGAAMNVWAQWVPVKQKQ